MDFEIRKKRELLKYEENKAGGFVDPEVYELNDLINSLSSFYTTSSCAGRCIVISKKSARSKYRTTFHFKTHNPEEIPHITLLDYQFKDELWLMVEAANFHIKCKNLESAKILHQSALEAKLGYSKFQSVDNYPIVEIQGTTRLAIPVGIDGEITIKPQKIGSILNIAYELLLEEQERLSNWHTILTKL